MLAAADRDAPGSDAALADLCETYWYPLYAYVRRRGYREEDARDRTQEFFARLLEKDYLRGADQERGRFRAFLLTAFKRFLSKERDKALAVKRGGGRRRLSLDVETAEGRYRLEPSHVETAERIYERRWALTLLERVLARLRERYETDGNGALFDRLKGFLSGEAEGETYSRLGEELDLQEGAVKVAVHRLRRRYGKLLREEIAQTVSGPEDVEDELRHLREALGG